MVPTPPTLVDLDANDALLLNAFQQQYQAQQQDRGTSSMNASDISLFDFDPTPIGNMNFNGNSSQPSSSSSQQQQLFELVQAMTAREQNASGLNNSNSSNANTNLFQQQLRQQQLANSNSLQNQSLPANLANLLGNQQQQQPQATQRHSLSLAGLDVGFVPQQRQHSLSLGTSRRNSIADTNVNALLALQQLSQQQQSRNSTIVNTNGNGSLGSKPTAVGKKTQKDFLLFIKILLKCLTTTQNQLLKERTKAIVSECTKRNRLGDPAYMPLQTAVEVRLRPLVGEQLWTRAENYVQSYHSKQPQLAQRVAQVRQQQRQQQLMRMAARC